MIKFKVLNVATGKEVSTDKIDAIAKKNKLMDMDIDGFYVGENGELVLADECGNMAYCDAEKLGLFPVLDGKYPDVEYLEAVFLGNLRHICPSWFENVVLPPRIELVAMFPQTWPDTAGGFSEPGMLAGAAMTTTITTVLRANIYGGGDNEYFGVFFGNKPAYMVDEANDTFFEDLRNYNLKSRYGAKGAY